MKTVKQIQKMTDEYDHLSIDCIGIAHVVSYTLRKHQIAHKVMFCHDYNHPGACNKLSDYGFTHHIWIELKTKEGKAVIDYRLDHCIGQFDTGRQGKTPHGVFLKQDYPYMEYKGERLAPEEMYPDDVIPHLLDPQCPLGAQAEAFQKDVLLQNRPLAKWFDTMPGGKVLSQLLSI
jgi:hypothetical protein